MKRILTILSAAALLLSSCQKDPAPSITITPSELVFAGESSSQTIKLLANVAWTASNTNDWIIVKPMSGEASSTEQTVTISVTTNEGLDRTGSVSFSLEGGNTIILNVVQACEPRLIVDAAESLDYAGDGGELTFTVLCNQEWTVNSDADWVTAEPVKGDPSVSAVTVKVTAQANTAFESREAALTVEGAGDSKLIKVTQGPATSITYAGETYKVVKMKDGKFWMAENLRYVPEGMTPTDDLAKVKNGVFYPIVLNAAKDGVEFSKSEEVIKRNGYLYQSEAALGLNVGDIKTLADAKSLNGAQGICPEGWHIPTSDDILALVGKAVSPLVTNENAPYYDKVKNNASIELLNEDGFNADAWGAVTIASTSAVKAALMGYLKTYPDAVASGYVCGSSIAQVTYNTADDETSGIKTAMFYGFMPMASTGTFNGSKLHYRTGVPVRCVKND